MVIPDIVHRDQPSSISAPPRRRSPAAAAPVPCAGPTGGFDGRCCNLFLIRTLYFIPLPSCFGMLSRLHRGWALITLLPLRDPLLRRASDAAGGCSPSSSFTVSYLVSACGMSPELAHATAQRVTFHSPEKADAVLQLLRSRGLNQSQVAECVRKNPKLLLLDARVLSPKFEVLEGIGFSGAGLAEMLARYPRMLDLSVNNRMLSSVAFLRTVVPKEGDFIRVLSGFPWILGYNALNTMAPNVEALLSHGVPMENVSKAFLNKPRMFTTDPSRFVELVQSVKDMGFHPSSCAFTLAILARTVQRKWDHNMKVFQSLGLSDAQIFSAFKVQPLIFTMSEDKIRKMMGFFVGVIGIAPSCALRYPNLLLLSLEKRIIPRYRVLELLTKRGIISRWNLYTVFQLTETRFLAKFVIRYQGEIPELLISYSANVVQ